MFDLKKRLEITPREFEIEVKNHFDRLGKGLKNYESKHLENVHGLSGGEYEIDITASFDALGGTIKILIECRHYHRKIERDDVLTVHKKMETLGFQKVILVTSFGFQKGALEYAKANGIALVVLQDGRLTYRTKSMEETELPPWAEKRVMAHYFLNDKGSMCMNNLTSNSDDSLDEIFKRS